MDAAAKPKYRAFVSYAHEDKKWASSIQRELETYRIPKEIVREAGLETNTLRPIFRDDDDLGSTHDLSEAIQDALTESETLIVVCSAAARKSVWVNREIEYFLELSPERIKRVYCLLVGGNVGDGLEHVLPSALSHYEGLAADVREGGDTPRRATLKLVSALIGVGLDRLIRRDRNMRRRRAAKLGTVVIGLALVIGFLVNESRESAIEAEEKTRAAGELVAYMLEDLEKRLDEFDGVAKLDRGFDTALAYFEGLDTGDMSNETLEQYFDALTHAGDLRLRQGNRDDALRIWERSSEISGRLIERNPSNADSWRRHGDSFISIALANWGKPDEIVSNTKTALEYFEKAAEMDPVTFNNHSLQVSTLNNLGAGYSSLAELENARGAFIRSLEMNEDLKSRSWPESANAMESLLRQEAESVSWLTEVDLYLGRAEAAVDWHEREMTIRREELGNVGDPVRLGDGLAWGAVAYEAIGDDETARSKRRESEQVFEELMQRDPDNFYWQRRYIESTLRRAIADINLGNVAIAEQTLADIKQRLDDLRTRLPDNDGVTFMLARMEIAYAELWVDSSTTRSLQSAERAMSHLDPFVQREDPSLGSVLRHAYAAALAAYAMTDQGMDEQGRALVLTELERLLQTSGGSNRQPEKQIEVLLLWLAGEQSIGDDIYTEMRERGYESNWLERWQERLQRQGAF